MCKRAEKRERGIFIHRRNVPCLARRLGLDVERPALEGLPRRNARDHEDEPLELPGLDPRGDLHRTERRGIRKNRTSRTEVWSATGPPLAASSCRVEAGCTQHPCMYALQFSKLQAFKLIWLPAVKGQQNARRNAPTCPNTLLR